MSPRAPLEPPPERPRGADGIGARYDAFWAGFLGVAPGDWARAGVSVRPHAGLRGYRGLWCFRRRQRIVVSAPAPWVERLGELAAGRRDDELMRPTFWARALGHNFDRAIGPAFQGRLDPARFTGARRDAIRPVTDADAPALAELEAACGADWNMPDEADRWRRAIFEDGVITALAGYRSWGDEVGDPCVITRPGARGRGRGTAVTAAVVAEALARGALLLYQTLESNEPAVRLARALGYERDANHLAVRLRRDAPG